MKRFSVQRLLLNLGAFVEIRGLKEAKRGKLISKNENEKYRGTKCYVQQLKKSVGLNSCFELQYLRMND